MLFLVPLASHGQVTTRTFQEGDANGYVGTQDTEVRGNQPDADLGALESVNPDNEDGGFPVHGLIRFDDIFGPGPNQVPLGETIIEATLTFYTFDPGNDTQFHRMLIDWTESSTWNTLVAGVSADDVEATVSFNGPIIPRPANTFSTVDVTTDLQAWASGANNYGWFQNNIGTGGGGGWDYRSSEYLADPTQRPLLTVSYGTATAPSDASGGTLPADASVVQGTSHTLTASFNGVPTPTVEWYHNGLPTGITGDTLTIASMTAADGGTYFARATNSQGSGDSRTATITYVADTVAPFLVGTPTILDNRTLVLSFSEPMNPDTNNCPIFFESFNVEIYPEGGDPFFDNLGVAGVPVLVDETNWVAVTSLPAQPGVTYVLNLFQGGVSDVFCNLNDVDLFDLAVDNQVAGPTLLGGAVLGNGNIELYFNEAMTDVSPVLGDISIYPQGGDPVADNLVVATLTLDTDTSTLVLTTTTAVTPGGSYSVRILAGAVADANGNVTEVDFNMDLGTLLTFVAAGSVWSYLDDGSDQGTAWKESGFDSSAWATGAAQLGYGDGGEITVVSFGPDSNAKYTTTYFRHSFTISDAAGISSLTLGLLRDDGAVVYINGTEVRRDNLPAAPAAILFNTLAGIDFGAIGGADEETFFESSVDPSVLVSGVNVIAVEIHQQSGNSSDIGFDLFLEGAGTFSVVPPSIVVQPTPASQTVNEGESASWTVAADGFPAPAIAWQLDNGGGFVTVGSGSTLTINPAGPSDAGTYRAVASNSGGSATSDTVTLIVNADTTRPTLLSGLALRDRHTVELTFSETMGASAGTIGNYSLELVGGGGALTVTNAAVNGDVVTLRHEEARADANYQVTVSNVSDAAEGANLIDPNPSVLELDSEIELIAAGASWAYLDDGSDQGTAWIAPLFDDSTWAVNVAELGYGDGDEDTVISFGPDSSNKYTTYYFRHSFTLVDPTPINQLSAELTYDDGAVVYLNGTEVHRVNMTNEVGNPILYTDFAGGAGDYAVEVFAIDPSLLVAGNNVVAVEIHQGNLTSSDVSMALALIGLTAEVVLPIEITATLDDLGNVILTWTGDTGNLHVQEATALANPASATVWTTRAGGPHASGVNVGPASGMRYFRLTDTP